MTKFPKLLFFWGAFSAEKNNYMVCI